MFPKPRITKRLFDGKALLMAAVMIAFPSCSAPKAGFPSGKTPVKSIPVVRKGSAGEPGSFLVIGKCGAPPVIDGTLDDECWKKAACASGFALLDTDGPAKAQTTARVAYDDKNLYIGFECEEPDTGGMSSQETRHDAQVGADDCIDVFLDLDRDYKNYFHFIVNSQGVTSDASVELVDDFIDVYYDWEPEYDVKTSAGEGRWFVEMAIPFASLMTGIARPSVYPERKKDERSAYSLLKAPVVRPGAVWNVNLCRRRRTDPRELSSWAPACDKFYMPYQFGHMVFKGGLDEQELSRVKSRVGKEHSRIVSKKNEIERERLKPVIEEIGKSTPGCWWTAEHRRNLFMGYEFPEGGIRVPNYARLDGQGRVFLPETIPPLPQDSLEKIIARKTPRLAFDGKSLAELRAKIENVPALKNRWLKLKGEADALLKAPLPGFVPCEMQWDRNCVARDKAKEAGAGYGQLGNARTKCALVYAVSGDGKYAHKAWEAQSRLMEHFDRYQVFRAASNWYSIWDASYEVYTSTWFFDMIASSGVLSREEKGALVEFIRRLGYRVDYCVKHSEMVGNHQFMWTGNFGCMASYFPEFPESERWAMDVEERMPRLYEDILTDGGQIERSPGHHVFGLRFLCRYVVARKQLAGENVFDKEYDGKSLEATLDWIAKIATPLGEQPAINDSKRPRIETFHFMLDIADRFGKGEYLRAGKIDTSSLPLEHLVSEDVKPSDPAYASVLLYDTGFAVMRDDWNLDSKYLLFDYGAHGAWHGHYDKMSFEMYADGVGWVLDAGASPHYCLYIKEHNEWHKQTVAHNTVLVDGKSQEATTGELREWKTARDFDLVSASHEGYKSVKHTRTVFHPRGEYFIVNDFIEPSDSSRHGYSFLLHVYAGLGKHDKTCIAFTRDGKGLLVLPAEPSDVDSLTIDRGLCIGTTGERKEPLKSDGTWTPGDPGWGYIPYIGLNKSGRAGNVNYLVVLFPFEDADDPPEVRCAKIEGEEGKAIGVRILHGGFEDVYGEKAPGADDSEIELGGFKTDAEYFFVRIKDGKVVASATVGGTRLFWKGEELAVETGK